MAFPFAPHLLIYSFQKAIGEINAYLLQANITSKYKEMHMLQNCNDEYQVGIKSAKLD